MSARLPAKLRRSCPKHFWDLLGSYSDHHRFHSRMPNGMFFFSALKLDLKKKTTEKFLLNLFCSHGSIQTTTPFRPQHQPVFFHLSRIWFPRNLICFILTGTKLWGRSLQIFPCNVPLTNLADNAMITFNLHVSTLKKNSIQEQQSQSLIWGTLLISLLTAQTADDRLVWHNISLIPLQ